MKYFDLLDRALVSVSVMALVAMMLLTTISVIGRYLFSMPIPDDLVMSEFLMIVVVFLPFSAVQAAREHVFVTIFTEWMSDRNKMIMETIGVVLGFFIFTIISMAVFTDFYQSWQVGAFVEGPLELPESPPRFILFFGLAVFTVRLLIDSITSVAGLFTGNVQVTKSQEARVLESEI